jgi:mRNA-degrading endonuclease RelE of RelBE toxin-antitoxin system
LNIFDILPMNFFNIFNTEHRRIYADCILLLYHRQGADLSFSMDKEDIIGVFEDYFDNLVGDSELDESAKTSREKAQYVYRRLKECGWIAEEQSRNYRFVANFEDYAISIIKTLSNLNKDFDLEYSGYVYLIYSMLKEFKLDKGAVIVEQAVEQTRTLLTKLKTLNANIRKYIKRLMADDTKENIRGLMEMLLQEYQEQVIDRAYYNLKTRDHPSKYRGRIIEAVDEILENTSYFDAVTNQIVTLKSVERTEAADKLAEDLYFIRDTFDSIDAIMDEIDAKNHQYISVAISRITFLLNEKNDIEGKINRILKAMAADSDLEDPGIAQLYEPRWIGAESLYTQRTGRKPVASKVEPVPAITEEELQADAEKLIASGRYTKRLVNHFAGRILGNRSNIMAHEVVIPADTDFGYLIMLYLYSGSEGMDYTVEEGHEIARVAGYRFRDFTIRRI